jgi:transcriptional/translational regulatory protein YebC/TACO1
MKPPLSPDPNANPRLAAALQKAKEGGVPKSGVENVLARVRRLLKGLKKEALADSRLELLLMDLELG